MKNSFIFIALVAFTFNCEKDQTVNQFEENDFEYLGIWEVRAVYAKEYDSNGNVIVDSIIEFNNERFLEITNNEYHTFLYVSGNPSYLKLIFTHDFKSNGYIAEYADSSGEFLVRIDLHSSGDTLIVKSIGYQNGKLIGESNQKCIAYKGLFPPDDWPADYTEVTRAFVADEDRQQKGSLVLR